MNRKEMRAEISCCLKAIYEMSKAGMEEFVEYNELPPQTHKDINYWNSKLNIVMRKEEGLIE